MGGLWDPSTHGLEKLVGRIWRGRGLLEEGVERERERESIPRGGIVLIVK